MEDYLRLRRALGFKLEQEGRWLAQFVSYVEASGESTLTSKVAIKWAQQPLAAQSNQWAKRLGVARKFAAYLHTIEPANEVPPANVFPARRHRPTPYLWSESDITRLIEATRAFHPLLRAETYEALFGLLAASGMRVGEAITLQRDDVDLSRGVITVRAAKFDRSRLVPLHASALRRYVATLPSAIASIRCRARWSSSPQMVAPCSAVAGWAKPSGG